MNIPLNFGNSITWLWLPSIDGVECRLHEYISYKCLSSWFVCIHMLSNRNCNRLLLLFFFVFGSNNLRNPILIQSTRSSKRYCFYWIHVTIFKPFELCRTVYIVVHFSSRYSTKSLIGIPYIECCVRHLHFVAKSKKSCFWLYWN